MNALILAAQIGGISIGQFALPIIVLAAVFAIIAVALRAMGIALPQWFWQIAAIIAVAVVAIIAIKIVLSL